MRATIPDSIVFAAVVTLAMVAACDKARPVPGTTGTASGCTLCHGSSANPAPPVDTLGASTGVKVGAHQAHLVKSNLRASALACADCHAVPTSTGHATGTVDMTWGALARTGGLAPTPGNLGGATQTAWEATPTCTNYCHGAGFAAAVKGSAAIPSWTGTAAASTACGSCHQAPPATSDHASVTSSTNCGSCHAGYSCTTASLATCTVDKATHLNGTVDVPALACNACHGSAANAAPPVDTSGASSGVKVGAHQAHLVKSNLRSAALGCSECHTVPTSIPHASGTVDMTWGALARTGGLTPAPGNLSGASQTSWEASPTCTNYCHGAGFAAGVKGSGATPSWTGAPVDTACGSCHQAPPATTDHASVTSSTNCGTCHDGYSCTTASLAACTVNKATHLNGAVDAPILGCVSCHGSAANAAPPVDTAGASTGVRVGAHQAHLSKSNLRSVVLICSDCHTVPTAIPHASGTVDMSWSALARTGGLTPTPGNLGGAARTTWEATPTCTNYCHGAGFAAASKGAAATPSWTGSAATSTACGSCHQAPPATSGHALVTSSTNCGTCHTGYSCTTASLSTCTVNKAIHLNGVVDAPNLSCSTCHGSATNAAPPVDTIGASTGVRVGAHQAHLSKSNLRSVVLTCADCHTVPTTIPHASGTVDMTWSALARTGGLTPTPGNLGGAARTTWEATPTCTNYCHGAGFDAAHAGTGTSPSWTGPAVNTACGSCHQSPPSSSAHASVTSSTNCGACHAGYSCTSGNLPACTVNKATHLNGTLDAANLTCTSCHGDSTQTATPAAPLYAAPPVDTAGLSSGGFKIGAHQKHLTSTTYRSTPITCQSCHASVGSYATSHANGTADVGFTGAPNANLQKGTWTAGAPGSCGSTWCHGAVINPANNGSSGGLLTTPTWTSTISACTACHAVTMGTLTNRHTNGNHTGLACSTCHGAGYSSSTVNTATHLDGTRTIVTTSSGTGIRSYSSGSCTPSCHGTESWY